MSIFDFADYRAFLREIIEKNQSGWGYQGQLAKAATCQASYFSQVLRGKSNLTTDHAAGIADFLKLTDDETDYLLRLVELEKAGPALREFAERKLRQIKRNREDLSNRFQVASLADTSQQLTYYSSWHWSAIHILAGSGKFTATEVAQRLLLPLAAVKDFLSRLEEMDLIVKKGSKWSNTKKFIHLPKDSPLTGTNHWNWRQRAIHDSQIGDANSLHYTAVQSISISDIPKFKDLLIKAIDQSRKLVKESGSEEGVCFTCDLFLV